MSNKHWFVAGISFGAGLVVGWTAFTELERAKLRAEFEESTKAVSRAMQMAGPVPVKFEVDDQFSEGVQKTKDYIGELAESLTISDEPQEIIVTDFQGEPVKNDYHKAISATATGFDTFVEGGVNDYGMSYIEEEEYLDEDGREKHQIVIMMTDSEPIFLMGGTPIDDWDRRIGDSILVDFYQLVPPGVEPILYVRNHRTDEDYEVIRETP